MDKYTAENTVNNAGMSEYDIAHSIYLATVQSISGANQNEGYGFALSAVAELWNIRGSIGNPNGRTKITGRYKGMGITEDMIMNIISQYPNGFNGREPLFDDLLGVGSENHTKPQFNYREERTLGGDKNQNVSNLDFAICFGAFFVLKIILGWGWLASFIVAFVIGGVVDTLRRR